MSPAGMVGISLPDIDPYAGIGVEASIDVPFLGDGSAGAGLRTGDRPFSDPQWNPRTPGRLAKDVLDTAREAVTIDNPYDNPKNPVSITLGPGIGSRRQGDNSRDTYIRLGLDISLGPISLGGGIEFGLNIDFPEDPDPGEGAPPAPPPEPAPGPGSAPNIVQVIDGSYWIEGVRTESEIVSVEGRDVSIDEPPARVLYHLVGDSVTFWDLGFLERNNLGEPRQSNAAYTYKLNSPNGGNTLLITGQLSQGSQRGTCWVCIVNEHYYRLYGGGDFDYLMFSGAPWQVHDRNFFEFAYTTWRRYRVGAGEPVLRGTGEAALIFSRERGGEGIRLSCSMGDPPTEEGRDPIPPRPPEPPMRCCGTPATDRMIKEIYEVLSPPAMRKASIPQRWIVPGGKGQVDIGTYPEAVEGVYRFIDNIAGYFPLTLKISDIQNAEGGKESLHIKVHNISDGLKQLLQLGVDTEDDVDTGNNLGARCLMENLMLHQLAVKNNMLLEAIAEYLDFKRKDRSIRVKMCGDPLGAEKHTKKLDEQGEEATEDLINYLANNSQVRVSVAENDDEQTLTKRLIEINRYAATAAAAVSEPAGGGIFDKVLRAAELAVAIDSMLNRKNVQEVMDNLGKDFEQWQSDAESGYPAETTRREGAGIENPYGRPLDQRPQIHEIDGKEDLNK